MLRTRRLPMLAIALAAIAVAATAAASADAASATTLTKGIWGPITRHGHNQFPIYRKLGAGVWNGRLIWQSVAPTRPAHPRDPKDPAYRWPKSLDRAIQQGRRYGQKIAVEVSLSPAWANGGLPGQWAPKRLQDYADFITAAARRYRGIRYWIIWSEASRALRWQPEWPGTTPWTPLTGRQLIGPHNYAIMLDEAYAALKRVSRRNLVVGGNTWTAGDISPLNWIRALKLPDGRPPRMDFYGHNPLTARRPDIRQDPIVRGIYDISDLDTLARRIDQYIGRAPNGKRMPLWIGEFFVPTDHPNRELNYWVTWKLQASWLRDALRLVRRDRRVATFNWLSLYDDAPAPDHLQVNRGLISWRGKRKPAFNVFMNG